MKNQKRKKYSLCFKCFRKEKKKQKKNKKPLRVYSMEFYKYKKKQYFLSTLLFVRIPKKKENYAIFF